MATPPAEYSVAGHISEGNTYERADAAKEAYILCHALFDYYVRIQYAYLFENTNPEFKGGWDIVANNTHLYTRADTTIQTINADTLYSFIGMDPRNEPTVISVDADGKPMSGVNKYAMTFPGDQLR